MIPVAIAAEMGRDHAHIWKIIQDLCHLIWAGWIQLWRKGVAYVDEEHEDVLSLFEKRKKPRIIQTEALKVGMEFEASHAIGAEFIQLFLPVLAVRMNGAERRYLGIGILKMPGIRIARLDLRRAGSRTERHTMIDAASLGTHKQIFGSALAAARELIVLVQAHFCLFGYARMKNMSMNVDEHDWLLKEKEKRI